MRRVDEEFQQELTKHLEMLAEEGVSPGTAAGRKARREARLRLGGTTQLRETNRDWQGRPFWIRMAPGYPLMGCERCGRVRGSRPLRVLDAGAGIGAEYGHYFGNSCGCC